MERVRTLLTARRELNQVNELERIGWLRSGAEVLEAKRVTVRLRASARIVQFGDVPPRARVTLEIPRNIGGRVIIRADSCAGDSRLSIEPVASSVHRLEISAEFSTVDVTGVTAPPVQGLLLASGTTVDVAAPSTWALGSATPEPADVRVGVHGDGDAQLRQAGNAKQARLTSLTGSGSVSITVDAGLAPGAIVDVPDGSVRVHTQASRLEVRARKFIAKGDCEAGCFHVTENFACGGARGIVVRDTRAVEISGRADGVRIQGAGSIEIGGALTGSFVTASEHVVAGEFLDSTVRGARQVRSGPDNTDSGRPSEDLPAATDREFYEWWDPEAYGTVSGCEFVLPAQSQVIIGSTQATNITADQVFIVGTLNLDGSSSLVTESLATGELRLESPADGVLRQLGEIEVLGAVTGDGELTCSEASFHGPVDGSHGQLRIAVDGDVTAVGRLNDFELRAGTIEMPSDSEARAERVAFTLVGDGGSSSIRCAAGSTCQFIEGAEHHLALDGEMDLVDVPTRADVTARLTAATRVLSIKCAGIARLGLPIGATDHVVLSLAPGRRQVALQRFEGFAEDEPMFDDVFCVSVQDSGTLGLALGGSDPTRPSALTVAAPSTSVSYGAALCATAETPEVRVETRAEAGPPCHLTVLGPVRLTLNGPGDIETLEFGPAPDTEFLAASAPSIRLGPLADVRQASGPVRVRLPHSGRLHGVEDPEDDLPPLYITGVTEADKEESESGGLLVDADVTGVPYSELPLLGTIEVVDPLPAPLRRQADVAFRGAARAELRSKAEWMSQLATVVGQQAISGESRAAMYWAAARLHHGSLPRRRPEYVARFVHEAFGYSWRPHTPVMTYLAVASLWCGVRIVADSVHDVQSNLFKIVGDVLTLPLGFVRLPHGAVLFANRALNVLATVTLALPLIFVVVAIRNYLRTPGDR